LASVWLPTESTTAAQRSFCNGLPGAASSARSITVSGAELLQVIVLGRLAGGGCYLEAGLGEQRDRDAADATGGAGDQHLALIRRDAVRDQRLDAQARGIAGGADRHRLARW
jgi:hypothetical protein